MATATALASVAHMWHVRPRTPNDAGPASAKDQQTARQTDRLWEGTQNVSNIICQNKLFDVVASQRKCVPHIVCACVWLWSPCCTHQRQLPAPSCPMFIIIIRVHSKQLHGLRMPQQPHPLRCRPHFRCNWRVLHTLAKKCCIQANANAVDLEQKEVFYPELTYGRIVYPMQLHVVYVYHIIYHISYISFKSYFITP